MSVAEVSPYADELHADRLVLRLGSPRPALFSAEAPSGKSWLTLPTRGEESLAV
jgi:hypothetical protein